MTEVTERDPLAIRGRILGEYKKLETQIAANPELWRKLSFEAHKEFCKVLGYDYVDYPEFEFWFSRFARGHFDLDYDRNSDPKVRSFADLPLDIFKNVGEYLELKDRLLLRDVCKDIRYQVDNWDLKVDEIHYGDVNNWQAAINRVFSGIYGQPISFVMSVLKLPNLKVEKLTIHEPDRYWRELIRELDESNRKLHVKKVEFPNYYRSSKINLHFLAPGVLEDIKMTLGNPNRKEMYEMIESEQCQSAKMVYIRSWTPTSQFPLVALYKCPRFTLRVGERPADGLKAMFLKKLMKYGEVQECVLYAQRGIMWYLKEPVAMVPNFPSLRRYPILGTNDFYELEYREKAVHLERKS